MLNPYVHQLQYNYYPDMTYDQINGYVNHPQYGITAQQHLSTLYPQMTRAEINGHFATMNNNVIDNAPEVDTKLQNQKQLAGGINNTVNSGLSAIPVYGQIYGAARGVAGLGQSFIKKDDQGNPKGTFGNFANEELTPVHEQAIADATQGKWGNAALDVLTGGQYKPIKSLFK